VRREEASLIEGLSPKGLLIVNGDDPQLLDAAGAYTGKRVTFGIKPTNDLYASDIICTFEGVRFKLNGQREVFIPLMGGHVAINALAAIAVGRRMGLSDEQIVGNLSTARGPGMRLELQRVRGMTILNDAYNANPASMQSAIELLCSLPAGGRRVAILGDMRELGTSCEHYHRAVGQFLAHLPINLLICVGDGGAMIADAAQTAGFRIDRVIWHKDSPAASAALPDLLSPGDLVLLKASRGMKFELIAESLSNGPKLKAAS
jgi:UDP-N-acetylmuramoyl-tripeptide--D-alanyl-D-alanine ligase